MSKKKYIRVPKGIATAIAHNRALIKMADAFLMLKHYDQTGSGCIHDFESTDVKKQVAAHLNVSLRTLYVRIDELVNTELARIEDGHLFLSSYVDFQMHCGALQNGNHYVKPKPNVRLEYHLRALIYKESQAKQTFMIIQKLKNGYNRLSLSRAEARKLVATEMEAIQQSFEQNLDYIPACRPDVGISHRTLSKWLSCLSHTSSNYWQHRLKDLGMIKVITNRKIESRKRSRQSTLVRPENVRYSRPMQCTFLQLPNLQLVQ